MRGDGKTTAQLIDIVENMLIGPQVVVYIWPERSTIRYAMHLFLDLMVARNREFRFFNALDAVALDDVCGIFRVVSLANDQFRTLQTIKSMRSPASIILDHACWDCDRRRSMVWEDMAVAFAGRELARPY